MNISSKFVSDNILKLSVDTTLSNVLHKEFRAAYENKSAEKIIIDLCHEENIDSSGLGMLLLLRDYSGADSANIEIINCSDNVLNIFHITCFFRLFHIPQYKDHKPVPPAANAV